MEKSIIRVTKAQKLATLKEIIPADFSRIFPGNDEKADYIFDHDEVMRFIDAEIALLTKKNMNKRMTKEQELNICHKEDIVAYLASLPADKEGATCTEMYKAIPSMADYSPQKVSALCSLLKTDGRINSKKVKGGKTVFFAL